ncbi:unnamed protein product [Vicia faba]|uniref:Uncharacterized protein n=1 Tax=Vicia faba TaxID=3906 RepID=A0AAV1AGL4_VICFA|nr:unnamed protein product [Vicia faba]
MPGPGPHLMFAMASGLCLTTTSNGRFSPHHTLVYTINAFFGPDIGSFSVWLASFLGGDTVVSFVANLIHDPFGYFIILGFPLSSLYSKISSLLLRSRLLHASHSRLPLTKMQCFLLISAGSFTHFFLDHLFEENGKTTMYKWILGTGWWDGTAPIYPSAVVVVGFLCLCLIGGFLYLNRASSSVSFHSMILVIVIAALYCSWCISQIYWTSKRRPAVGEEADLGVLVFLAVFFFLPYALCIMSMYPRGLDSDQIPR